MGAADRLGPARQVPYEVPQEAVVHRVDGPDLYVRLVGSGQRFVHGPCVWSRPMPADALRDHRHNPEGPTVTNDRWDDLLAEPPPGTRCLVVRSDARRWWVIAFDSWPDGG